MFYHSNCMCKLLTVKNVKTGSYRWCAPGSSGTTCTEEGKSSQPAHTHVWEAETESALNNLFSGKQATRSQSEMESPSVRACAGELQSARLTCTHPTSMAWRTCARFFMMRTSSGVESAHWPFWMGLMKRFRNSFIEPRRFFLMKLTMQWSVWQQRTG